MSGLAEEHLDDAPARVWLIRGGIVLGLAAIVGLTVWIASSLKSDTAAPRQQVAKIAILPDTPPPPPPPPKDEPKPEPPKEQQQEIRENQPKPAEAPKPANEPIKMEGAAGDGPSAFAAGSVSRDYAGGAPQVGAPAASSPPSFADRAQERLYANSVRALLRDDLERRLKLDADQVTATFAVWLDRNGAIERFALEPSGNASSDEALQRALTEAARDLRLPEPPGPLPAMRFRLTLKPQA